VTAFYAFGSRLFELGFRAFDLDRRVTGVEHIPSAGPAIIASNHVGYLDFCFVMLGPPRPRREVRFLARSEFFERRVTGFLLRRLRQIPVDVYGDPRTSIEAATAALRAGELVGLHPEGTISPSFVPRRGKSGAIRLADATGAPIIPAAVWGSHRLLTKGRRPSLRRHIAIEVRYGPPLEPTSDTVEGRTDELMARIRDLLADAQAAYPQRPDGPGDDWWIPAHLGGSAPTPEEAEARLAAQREQRRQAREQRARKRQARASRRRWWLRR
jgi:1-acyl-sn-glycerol-3-phosphate acyltransferase